MFDDASVAKTMSEVLHLLQNTDIIDDEKFLVLIEEDFVVDQEENRCTCYGKPVADREYIVQGFCRCLHRSWWYNDFRINKLGVGVYQFYFKKRVTMEQIVTNGPWNIEDHILILTSWSKQPLDEATSFAKIELWVHISGLPYD